MSFTEPLIPDVAPPPLAPRRPLLVRLYVVGLTALALLGSGCAFRKAEVQANAIRCQESADCPVGALCWAEAGRCVDSGTECVTLNVADSEVRAVSDGTGCSSGICVQGGCVSPRCGDGIFSAPEACDDGNQSNVDECTSECKNAVCGDGYLQLGVEACDDGNAVNGDGCDNNCVPSGCGNGAVSPNEECDDGNLVNEDGCDKNCRLTGCGNGIRTGDERCDDGNGVEGDGCDSNCTVSSCGNGIRAGDEECDDGNESDTDECTTSCSVSRCGDGFVQVGEVCDDGNRIQTDACLNDCTLAGCGDGFIRYGVEECDDGNGANDDECLNTCVTNTCGDGYPNPAREQCDDANDFNSDFCLNSCVLNRCGDGFVNPSVEECDDGNADDQDACKQNCTRNICGDGVIFLGGEGCDDGNRVDGDGCRADCTKLEVCGDVIVDANEDCDDGNENPYDLCHGCQEQSWSADWIVGASLFGRQAEEIEFVSPHTSTVDSNGNVLISDSDAHRVWRVSPDGEIRVIAGIGVAGRNVVEGTRAAASLLDTPRGLAVDPRGRIYIADSQNHIVRRIDQDGFIETVVGNGLPGRSGDGEPATKARLSRPYNVTLDDVGRLYVAEYLTLALDEDEDEIEVDGGGRVRRVNADGTIVTLVGGGATPLHESSSGASATEVRLNGVSDVAVDSQGYLYIAEPFKHRVTRVSPSGQIYPLIGEWVENPVPGPVTTASSPALTTPVLYPLALAVGANDELWIADSFNYRLGRVAEPRAENPVFRTVTTTGTNPIVGLDLDADNNALLTLGVSNQVFRWTDSLELIAGRANTGARGDGTPALSVALENPTSVARAPDGTLYIADRNANRIRAVSPEGIITTVAGLYFSGYSGENRPATRSALSRPEGVALDSAGNIWIADTGNDRVRKIPVDPPQRGDLVTVVGDGETNFNGASLPSSETSLNSPFDVRIRTLSSGDEYLYIADTGNHAIRRMALVPGAAEQVVETIVGGDDGFSQSDGALGPDTDIELPTSIAVDASGRVYFTEPLRNRVRRLDLDGRVYTVAGNGEEGGYGDGGAALAASVDFPLGLALLNDEELLIAETNNLRVRRVNGLLSDVATITAFAGTGPGLRSGDGGDPKEAVLKVRNLSVADDGVVYFAGGTSGVVQKAEPGNGNQFTLWTVAGSVFPAGTLGNALSATLYDLYSLSWVDELLLVSTGSTGFIQGIDLSQGIADVLVGYPRASSAVNDRAKYAPEFEDASAMVFSPEQELLWVGDAETGEISRIGMPAIDGLASASIWTHERFKPRPGHRIAETQTHAAGSGEWVSLASEAVQEGEFVSVFSIDLGVDPGDVDLFLAFDVSPTERRYDCFSAEDAAVESCELMVPAGASRVEVRALARVPTVFQANVNIWESPLTRQISGLAVDGAAGRLWFSDAALHCVREMNLQGDILSTTLGTCGRSGSGMNELLRPKALLYSTISGALYVADVGNGRVQRLDVNGAVTTVLGDGTLSNAGEGVPARTFPILNPGQMAMDDYGNLFVAAQNTVRQVANIDGDLDADGDDAAYTIFWPERQLGLGREAFDCIRGLSVAPNGSVYAADSCEGVAIVLDPRVVPQ